MEEINNLLHVDCGSSTSSGLVAPANGDLKEVASRPALRLISINSLHRSIMEKAHQHHVASRNSVFPMLRSPSWPVFHVVPVRVCQNEMMMVTATIRRLASTVVLAAHAGCHHSVAHGASRKRTRSRSAPRSGDGERHHSCDDSVTTHSSSDCISSTRTIDELHDIVHCIHTDRRQWKDDEASRHPVLAMFPHAHAHHVSARLHRCQQLGGVALIEALLIGLEDIDVTQ
jgi:hypothetical protein